MSIAEPGKATRFVWFLGVALVLMFTCVLLAPALFRFFHPDASELQFDEQLKAQLTTLLVGLVWWAIGSSQGSMRKDELNAAQQARTVEALAPGSSAATTAAAAAALAAAQAAAAPSALAGGGPPTGTPEDPVSVKAAPGGMKP
jgi:hypothetical protein